jgi:hypothetical protein
MGDFCADSPLRWASLAPSGPESLRIPRLTMRFFEFFRNFRDIPNKNKTTSLEHMRCAERHTLWTRPP